MDACKQWFEDGLKQFGRSRVEWEIKTWKRKRLDIGDGQRPEREKLSPAQREKMFVHQHGRCGICRLPMDFEALKSSDSETRLEVDHINVNLTGAAYTHRRNLQLAHGPCNRKKSADSVAVHAKKTGRTIREIIHPEDEM